MTVDIRGDSRVWIKLLLAEVYGFPDEPHGWFSGYEVRATAVIQVDGFQAEASFTTSTGELNALLQELTDCHKQLAGKVKYASSYNELTFELHYIDQGHVDIQGVFAPTGHLGTELRFSFASDQSFMQEPLTQLKNIAMLYGRR